MALWLPPSKICLASSNVCTSVYNTIKIPLTIANIIAQYLREHNGAREVGSFQLHVKPQYLGGPRDVGIELKVAMSTSLVHHVYVLAIGRLH